MNSALREDGVENIVFTFFRHGEAESGPDDKYRCLSTRGVLEARKCSNSLLGLPQIDLVLTSSAKRTIETASVIVESLNISPPAKEIEELYLPIHSKDRAEVINLLRTLGAQSLKSYLLRDQNGAWKRYTQAAFEKIKEYVTKQQYKHVLIVGHGNIINSLGLLLSCYHMDLLEKYFNFCEGFTIQKNQANYLL